MYGLLITENNREHRPSEASDEDPVVIYLKPSGQYLLISRVEFEETDDPDEADFSYPPNQIYYKHSSPSALKDLTFSLTNMSTEGIANIARVQKVPTNASVAVLVIDGYAFETFAESDEELTFTVHSVNVADEDDEEEHDIILNKRRLLTISE